MSFFDTEAYTDLCDIWSFVPAVGASGPTANTYTLTATGVRCRFVSKPALELPSLVGMMESDDLTTADFVRLPESAVVDSSTLFVNRTLKEDGSQGPFYNKGWVASGEPKRRLSVGRFPQAGRVVAYVRKEPQLPANIRTYYGI